MRLRLCQVGNILHFDSIEVGKVRCGERGNLARVKAEQDSILELYRMDVSRYARGDTLYVRDIFDQIPSQLSTQGKRFTFSSVRPRGTFDDFARDFLWLVNAGVALEVRNVSEPRHPLRLSENRKLFKLLMNAVGLLLATWSTTGRWPTCPSTWPRCSDGEANSGRSICGSCRRASAARRALGRLLEVSGGNPFALLFGIGLATSPGAGSILSLDGTGSGTVNAYGYPNSYGIPMAPR